MGAWDVKLYSSDTAADTRDDYIDKLRRGGKNEEVIKELIEENEEILEDVEEAAEFWFALAHTQWKYGRLLPVVKENALRYLGRTEHLERWKESGIEQYNARVHVLAELKAELLSPMPPEKKISQHRIYQCEWKNGDVFAYQFDSDYSKIKGLKNRYIIFRKVDEEIWWPGHIVPVVQVYKWIGNELPALNFIHNLKVLPQFYVPSSYKNLHTDEIMYRLVLLSTSKRIIPRDNLHYIGNLQNDEIAFTPIREMMQSYKIGWKNFEQYIIDNYLRWEKVDIY